MNINEEDFKTAVSKYYTGPKENGINDSRYAELRSWFAMMDVPVEMVLGEIINNPYMVKVVVVHLLRPAHLDEITRLIPQFERISPVDNEMPALTILKVWQSKAIMDSIASTARAKFISVKRVCPTENLE